VASSSSAASEGVKERRWEEREPLLQQDEEALDVEGAGGGGGGGKKKPPPPQLPPINPLRVRAFFVAAVLTVFTSSLVPSITSRASIRPFQIAINYAGVWVEEDMPTPISLLPCEGIGLWCICVGQIGVRLGRKSQGLGVQLVRIEARQLHIHWVFLCQCLWCWEP
jgi:hypothetical protein